jgi:hypothetical protein
MTMQNPLNLSNREYNNMAGMPLDKIRDILGQVDERITLGYIYNPNTEQQNLDIMNKALNNSNKKNKKM